MNATFSNSGLVPQLDGQTFVLTWVQVSTQWAGTLPCGVTTTGISMQCLGSSCTGFQLSFCSGSMFATAAGGCTCSPLNLVFTITTDATCSCYPPGVTFTITVTA